MKTVRYSDREKMIVEEGLAAVERVLTGDDTDTIERLLLCLDYYMDPYYGNRLPYERELIVLLQNLILSSNPLELKQDALQLLTSYAWPPFSVLERGMAEAQKGRLQLDPALKQDMIYALSMAKEEAALTALLEKCVSIIRSMREEFKELDQGRFGALPQCSIVKYCAGADSEPIGYFKNATLHTWKLEQDKYTLADNALCHQQKPVSGMFFPQGGFWISFDLERGAGYLIYQLGPRFGRGFTFDLVFPEEGGARLENERVDWVS